ncbi:hypothetical protein OHS70_34330 [Streptomyces sp. NBC_00390]|uniref:hypothetical protein n=1 Tax=Streptomyces sp. NBC_00390 TaxID=2975736 RepID=UPI002E1E4AD1
MTHPNAQLAPMPDHNRTGDPLWRKLWHTYEPVITPLRRLHLVTDVETGGGGEFGIVVALKDGSHLWISSVGDLPTDPSDLQGFLVARHHEDTPTVDEIVYDSTPDGEQAANGNNIVPLFLAISAFVTARNLRPPLITLSSVRQFGVGKDHRQHGKVLVGPFDNSHEAVKQYGYETYALMQSGWRCIHEQGGTDWPLTVWEREGAVLTVFLQDEGEVPA